MRRRSSKDPDESDPSDPRGHEPESGPGAWTLQVFERGDGSRPFVAFAAGLDSYRRLVLDTAVTTVLARQGNNVCDTEWGKALGRGLYEFRVRRSLSTLCNLAGIDPPADLVDIHKPVLLRVFFAVEGAKIVLLVSGYDKGAQPSPRRQDKEISLARKLLTEHHEDRRRHSR